MSRSTLSRQTWWARIGRWSAFVLALGLAAVAVWIVVPAPTRGLLVLGVGAPEVSPWLLGLAVLAGVVAAVNARTSAVARVTLVLAGATVLLALIPLAQFASTARASEAAMTAALGSDYWSRVPPQARDRIRPSAMNVWELFTGLRVEPVRVTRGVVFGTADGVPLTLDLYRPADDSGALSPAVVQVYGGAWQRGSPGDNAVVAQELAARGFIVFAIDYRHAPQWRWPAQLHDVRLALRWIRANGSRYGADTSRLALFGRSAGAHLAMLAAYEPGAPTVRAVVNYYGPVDLIEGYRQPPRPDPLHVRQVEIALFGGRPDQVPAAYRAASPITYATRVLPPTLSIYGAHDHIVEPRFGAALDARLRAAGTTSVLLVIPWAEHAFDAIPHGPSGQLALYHTERFLAWAFATNRSAGSP